MATASNINWWKVAVFAGIAAGLFLYGRSCGISSVFKTSGKDTTIYRDTVIRQYVPYPVNHFHDTTIYRPFVVVDTDTVDWVDPVNWVDPVDTAAIMRDYNATRFYSDTQAVSRGSIIIQDSVTENRIKARRLTAIGLDTVITNTVVLTPPSRIVGYMDLTGMGGRHEVGAAVGFSLKLPSDRVYGVGVSYLWNGKLMYYGRASIPIRIKK